MMKTTILKLAAVLILSPFFISCRFHGERTTKTVVENRVLPRDEFKQLVQEHPLGTLCYWYCGRRKGYSYVEIDAPQPIDKYDDYFNRRVHHTLRRFRISEAEVIFSPAMPFSGYGKGKRIVALGFADSDSVTYQLGSAPSR